MNPRDISPLFTPFDPNDGARFVTRELEEELRLSSSPELELLGGIYDPRVEVSRQHLGVLYSVDVEPDTQIEVGERGFLMDMRIERIIEIQDRIEDFENWSELVAGAIRDGKL